MTVRMVVVREQMAGESRVALVPDSVGKLAAAGYQIAVEAEAGRSASFSTRRTPRPAPQSVRPDLAQADLVVGVQPLPADPVRALRPGAATISFFPPRPTRTTSPRASSGGSAPSGWSSCRGSPARSRWTRSARSRWSPATAGAIVAAGRLRQFFPLSMTAAGTVPPAQVVVLGAGVAGLQAIATCRRLGAVVKGYDVRAAAAEEISSWVPSPSTSTCPSLEGAGGYAREMTEERAVRQRRATGPVHRRGRRADHHGRGARPARAAAGHPEMVARMKPGSVVVDLAARLRRQRRGRAAGAVVQVGGVQVWGGPNVPSQMPAPASRLYAQNVRQRDPADDPGRYVRPRLRRRDRRRHVPHPRRRGRGRCTAPGPGATR